MLNVSYCGRIGSFSHEAAVKMFPNAEYKPCDTFIEAVNIVKQNIVQYAVIPIENSTAGRVAEIHNILPTLNLKINKEKILKITHNLYVLNSNITLNDVKTVESHPQALMQCSNFLDALPVRRENSLNTAIAAEDLMKYQKNTTAVICSKTAGDFYKLHLLQQEIQNMEDNYTTFIAVSKTENSGQVFTNPLTSIIFTLTNKTGGIYEALGCFARNNVNLLKLESYIPTGINAKHAQFLLTFQGSNQNKNVNTALSELLNIANEVKNLGSYEADLKRF